MQAKQKALAPDDAAALFAYLASGGAIRVYAPGASAINPATGKADRCPLPVATRRYPVTVPRD